MIKINGTEIKFDPGMSMQELAERFYTGISCVNIEEFVVAVNGIAIPSLQARDTIIKDNDVILIVPKLECG